MLRRPSEAETVVLIGAEQVGAAAAPTRPTDCLAHRSRIRGRKRLRTAGAPLVPATISPLLLSTLICIKKPKHWSDQRWRDIDAVVKALLKHSVIIGDIRLFFPQQAAPKRCACVPSCKALADAACF